LANGSILVRPSSSEKAYSVSVHLLNGQQIVRKTDVEGVSAIPVTAKGMYLVDIDRAGQIQREIVQVF
jgi:hypothetical protein